MAADKKSQESQSFNKSKRAVDIIRSEEHTSELQSQFHLVCRLLLEKKYIKYSGFGIEQAVSQLNLYFPQAKIVLVDKEHQDIPTDFQIVFFYEKRPPPDIHLPPHTRPFSA